MGLGVSVCLNLFMNHASCIPDETNVTYHIPDSMRESKGFSATHVVLLCSVYIDGPFLPKMHLGGRRGKLIVSKM